MVENKPTRKKVSVYIANIEDIPKLYKTSFKIPFLLQNAPNEIIFVAREIESKKIVGYAICEKVPKKNFLEIKKLSTKKNYFGFGIGRKIVGRVSSYALKNNFNLFITSVPVERAVNFWRTKAKFRKVPLSEKAFGLDVNFFKKPRKAIRKRNKS